MRRTLTIKTPYVNAGIDGTEVYVQVADFTAQRPARGELTVLEGEVSPKPGAAQSNSFAGLTAMAGDRVQVDALGRARRTSLPSPGEPVDTSAGVLAELALAGTLCGCKNGKRRVRRGSICVPGAVAYTRASLSTLQLKDRHRPRGKRCGRASLGLIGPCSRH